MAYQPNRRRHPASKALIDLRRALGLTQEQFATRLLKVAAVTLAQWETSRPPQGDLLGKLGEIAQKERLRCEQSDVAKALKLIRLERRFRHLRIAEAVDKLGFDVHLFHATEEDDADGFALLRLHGFDQMMSIQTLRVFWEMLDLPETPKTKAARDAAAKAIENLNKALDAIDHTAYETQRAATEALQYVEHLTITIKPKERTTTTK